VGGIGLLGSLLLPWVSVNGDEQTGIGFLAGTDALLLATAIVAIAAAVTGGRIGVFRRDVSLNGAADLLSLASALAIAWLLLFDLPAEAGTEAGALVALAAALLIACAAGDYGVFRGEPVFPGLRKRPTS
jgi:hypothetical protein